jgi:hypothetical protein
MLQRSRAAFLWKRRERTWSIFKIGFYSFISNKKSFRIFSFKSRSRFTFKYKKETITRPR